MGSPWTVISSSVNSSGGCGTDIEASVLIARHSRCVYHANCGRSTFLLFSTGRQGPVSAAKVTCPQCDAPLKSSLELVPGKRIKCPRCGAAFTPRTDGSESN